MVLPEAKAIGSVAISLLGAIMPRGDALQQPRCAALSAWQGTQLLQEIAQMLPGLLERWIERA